MKKINDFGAKIGGAKKDEWALFHSLPETEQKKDVLWRRPKYENLISNGIPKEVLFWRNEMRKAVNSRPSNSLEAYVTFCTAFRDAVEKCCSMEDIENFYEHDISQFMTKLDDKRWKYTSKATRPFFDGASVLRYVNHQDRIKADCSKSDFLETIAEKEAKKYQKITVTKENLTVSPYSGDKFANKVKLPGCLHTFFDTQDYSKLLEDTDSVIILVYDKHRLGIFNSESDADAAIEKDKEKREENKKSIKKTAFLPPHLSKIERTGSDYRFFRMADGNVLLSRYGLRGGEFGNYTSSKDRLASINMAYDAFEDLYTALGISPKDISLGGKLAVAFGARGKGSAMAHYEPMKNVINITKIRGAGSLAHEWGHAMDMYIGTKFNASGFMSSNLEASDAPESMKSLVKAIMEKSDGVPSDFLTNSKYFDKKLKKSGNGYWASNHEMLARAFACYVKDKLNGKSDYLVGHAEYAAMDGKKAYPTGEERENINKKFDALILDMIEKGIFSKIENTEKEEPNIIEIDIFEGSEGQMRFC